MAEKFHQTIIQKNGKLFIRDPLRKMYVAFTPEEDVRQQLISFLLQEKKFPPGLIAVEKQIRYHQSVKRFDILVYDRLAKPLVLVECKAPEVNITQATFFQSSIYNSVLKAPFLIVTNGLLLFIYNCKTQSFLPEIPEFDALVATP